MTVREVLTELMMMDRSIELRLYDNFGEEFTFTGEICSWRGSYKLPAVIVQPTISDTVSLMTVGETIDMLKMIDGLHVEGWKGGDFILNENDTLFLVSHPGTMGNSATIQYINDNGVIGVMNDAY